MKIHKTNTAITAAENKSGTHFYKTNAQEIIDALKEDDANVWLIAAFEQLGLDALDFDHHMWGSYVDENGNLYICVSDLEPIEVNGEEVDPEEAFEDYSPEELSAYIEPATPKIITDRISEIEIKHPYFDGWAADLLEGGHSFL